MCEHHTHDLTHAHTDIYVHPHPTHARAHTHTDAQFHSVTHIDSHILFLSVSLTHTHIHTSVHASIGFPSLSRDTHLFDSLVSPESRLSDCSRLDEQLHLVKSQHNEIRNLITSFTKKYSPALPPLCVYLRLQ